MLRGASRPLVPPARHASSRPRTSTTTTARSAAGAAAPPPSLAESQRAQQLAQLPALLSELSQLAASSGPRGPARALAGARALVELASEAALDVSAGRPLPSQPALLRRLFEKLGATYVKLGQFIASSPTLFPADYVKEMQTCLDSGPAVPFTDIKRIIESELRSPLGSLFESVEQTPLASASIAQVHAAVLKGSRKEVVIKVLKPGVADALAADLAFISGSVRVLEFLAPALSRASLANIAADVRAAMLDEVDFRKEAAHAREFSAFLDTDPAAARAVGTPYVYPALSTERVMTMDRIRGVPLTDLDSVAAAAARRGETARCGRAAKDDPLATTLAADDSRESTRRFSPKKLLTFAVLQPETVLLGALNTWAASVVACRTFHADLHAGNALVGSDGKVYFIDFGIVGTVDTKTWGAVSALLAASASGEWRAAAAALVVRRTHFRWLGCTVSIPFFARPMKR